MVYRVEYLANGVKMIKGTKDASEFMTLVYNLIGLDIEFTATSTSAIVQQSKSNDNE